MSRRLVLAPLLLAASLWGQMTVDQRVFDFQHLAALYAKQYAPYEWKRDRFDFDLYELRPWLDRVRAARTDLEFFEICAEYVASLRDTHSSYGINSNFSAAIGINADIYDGRVLIEGVNRLTLPAAQYPFAAGDEVVSVDGQPVARWIDDTTKVLRLATDRGSRRLAVGYLFSRFQSVLPRAAELGERMVLVVRRRQTGNLETYEIPWVKFGEPVTAAGPVPSPRTAARRGLGSEQELEEAPEYLRPFLELGERSAPEKVRLVGWGARAPSFVMPAGFVQRLGRSAADFHFSGTYEAEGKRIGFLRIPNFSPQSQVSAVRELETEVAFFQANTDGLVVDVTRNTGGGCYGDQALRRLIPYPFELSRDEVRATLTFQVGLESSLLSARALGAESWVILALENMLKDVRMALAENRGRTGPIPFCDVTHLRLPLANAYSKPLIVLTDELTLSWGDVFAAVMQDSGRGPLFGYRTDGAGGSVAGGNTGFYSEASTSYSITMGVRQREVATPDFGSTAYLENVGVRPDIEFDVMTETNFLQAGRPFVQAFTAAIVRQIEGGR